VISWIRNFSASWDWRLSAHVRLASLATLWLGILVAPGLGPLLVPLVVARSLASLVQLFHNRQLAKRETAPRRDRLDYAIFGLAFLGSMLSAVIRDAHPATAHALLVLPALVPFSVLQLRTCRRSLVTHERRQAVVIPFARLVEQRAA
jgi:hypothetical protein